MSGLSVVDVQKALRDFADRGHDVLRHPHQVHIDDKPYGMVVGTRLGIYNNEGNTYKSLRSTLHQTERPLLSEINTDIDYGGRKLQQVLPVRRIIEHVNSSGEHKYMVVHAPSIGDAGDVLGRGSYNAMFRDDDMHSDAHEALKSHTLTKDGKPYVPTGGTFAPKDLHFRPMTDEEHNTFDEKSAVADLTHPAPPYSGLIVVSHRPSNNDGLSRYIYDHKTEQLLSL